MPRLFIGWKSGVGGVVKIMANNADDPLTTPNTDWWKFRFNSETAAIGYGDYILTRLIPSDTYSWDGVARYYPNATTPQFMGGPSISASLYYLNIYAYPNNIFSVKNAFHYMMAEASVQYQPRYYLKRKNYANSSDGFVVSSTAIPYGRMVVYSNNGTLSVRGVDHWDSNRLSVDPFASNQPMVRAYEIGTVGQADSSVPYNSGPYSSSAPWINYPQTYAAYTLDLPVGNSAYPPVAPGAPVSGQKMVRIDPATAKMSKPGYDVDTATDAQLIFNSNKLPMKIIKTGVVNIAAGATLPIPMGRTLAGTTFVDYQTSTVNNAAWVPPLPEDWSSEIWTMHRFSGTNLILWNRATQAVWVRYIVMAQDDLAPSVGTAKVFDANGATGNVVLRRPGTAGSRFADTILDSDLAYMPIIANAYSPIASAIASDNSTLGDKMWNLTWTNAGNFTPYILMRLHVRLRTDATQQMYMPPFAKQVDLMTGYAASTFIARLENTRARVYCRQALFQENAYRVSPPTIVTENWDWEPIGLRYYIFAIPNAL